MTRVVQFFPTFLILSVKTRIFKKKKIFKIHLCNDMKRIFFRFFENQTRIGL